MQIITTTQIATLPPNSFSNRTPA